MEKTFDLKQIINEEGHLVDLSYREKLTKDFVTTCYQKMLFIRLYDKKCVKLQRQGRIGTYVPFEGQEASQVGSSLALSKGDWMFPTYRDHGAELTFGFPLVTNLIYWQGRFEGQVTPKDLNIFPPAVPISSQLLHAVGASWAEKKKGSDRVALVYFGDGATSEGDFHEALNFSSVFQTPTIFFNQNNGFAISVPVNKQMHAGTIAQRAQAYDIEGIRIDGNDVFAAFFETKKAINKARLGGGPTLIESITWRYGGHTTADDPKRYRDQSESERRRKETDPLLRVEKFLKVEGMWDEEKITAFKEQTSQDIEEAIKQMEAHPDVSIDHIFDYVFETSPWPIEEQKQSYLDSLNEGLT